jgi:hypothetical protein
MESVNRIKEILNGMNIKKSEYSTKLKINKEEQHKKQHKK